MIVPSGPVFPWVCPLPQPPLGYMCLGDCLKDLPKKHIDASCLYDCAHSDMHSLYVLIFF